MRKFITGKQAGRFNQIIDDVSELKSRIPRNAYSGNFGVVRCFLLTDTSAEPMVATGVQWDSDTSTWIQNGLGDAVEVYPSPNSGIGSYSGGDYIYARNFGGRWFAIDNPTSGWEFVPGTFNYLNASFTMDGTNRYLDISASNAPLGSLIWGQLEGVSSAAGNEAKVWGYVGSGGIRLVSQVASVKMYATGLIRNYNNIFQYNIHSNFSGGTVKLYLRYYIT